MLLFLISHLGFAIKISCIYKEVLLIGLILPFFKWNFKERHWEIQWVLHYGGDCNGFTAFSETEILPSRKSTTSC